MKKAQPTRARSARRLVVAASLVLTSLLAFACRVTPLDVGVDRPMLDEDAAVPEAAAPDVTVVDASKPSRLAFQKRSDQLPSAVNSMPTPSPSWSGESVGSPQSNQRPTSRDVSSAPLK